METYSLQSHGNPQPGVLMDKTGLSSKNSKRPVANFKNISSSLEVWLTGSDFNGTA
jgi:hypothetical protein